VKDLVLPVILGIRKNLVLLFEKLFPRIFQAFGLQNDTKSFSADTVEDFFFPLAATLHINHLLFSGKYVPICSIFEKCTT